MCSVDINTSWCCFLKAVVRRWLTLEMWCLHSPPLCISELCSQVTFSVRPCLSTNMKPQLPPHPGLLPFLSCLIFLHPIYHTRCDILCVLFAHWLFLFTHMSVSRVRIIIHFVHQYAIGPITVSGT